MFEQYELPNKAYYVQPMFKDQLDMGYKVPVIIVKKSVKGYFKTDYEVSSWTELNGLNDSIGCDNVDGYVLQSLSVLPYGNVDKLYQAGCIKHCNILL